MPWFLQAKQLGKVWELWKELEERSWLSGCRSCCWVVVDVVVVQVVVVERSNCGSWGRRWEAW